MTGGRNPAARFASLDVMRGICAVIVMAMHSRMLTGYDPFPEGYLVVDLFFMMSGFVLGYAYDNRLKRGGYLGTFLLRRYARLLPMWMIGVAIGALLPLYFALKNGHFAEALALALTQLVLVPIFWRAALSLAYLFPFNTPGWSLFCELVVNFFYGLFARFLTRPALIALVVLAWLMLALAAFWHGGLWGGSQWRLAAIDLARVGWSFFAGLLIYALPRPREGGRPARLLFAAGLVLMAIFARIGPAQNPDLRALRDLATVSIFMPLLMWSALKVDLLRSSAAEILGMISYPLYAIHLPVLATFRVVYGHFNGNEIVRIPMAYNILLLCCTVTLAYLLGRFVDPLAQRRAAALIGQRPVRVPTTRERDAG